MPLFEQLQKQGISFHFNVEIESISQINEGYTLQGTGFELDTDYVVMLLDASQMLNPYT